MFIVLDNLPAQALQWTAFVVLAAFMALTALLILMMRRLRALSTLDALRSALNCAPSALGLFDRDQRLIFHNDAFAEVIGNYGIKTHKGMSFQSIVAGANARGLPDEITEEALAQAKRRNPKLLDNVRIPDGRWMQTQMAPTPDGGFVHMVTDVTQQLEMLRDMSEAREQAEAASLAKSEFLANMSHEIRTPLNAVLGMAQVMELHSLDAGQRERLNTIESAGRDLLSIISGILDMSRVQSGALELEIDSFDLETVVVDACAAQAPVADAKGLDFSIVFEPQILGSWRGDAGRLGQVLSNLIDNAVKFTVDGRVAVDVRGNAGGVLFCVCDSGIGIAANKLELIFERFAQVDTSATRRFGGAGLGLALCREFAQLMGGRLGAHSLEGEGSTFTLWLPLEREARSAAAQEPAAAPDVDMARRLRILAAEDNATNRMVLNAVLEPLGVDLTIAEDGAEAVALFQPGAFDLILMDIQMPRMNGIEAATAIRAAERAHGSPRTPILAVTANVMTSQVASYLSAGMDGCVAKPIGATTLFEAIDQALTAEAPKQTAVA